MLTPAAPVEEAAAEADLETEELREAWLTAELGRATELKDRDVVLPALVEDVVTDAEVDAEEEEDGSVTVTLGRVTGSDGANAHCSMYAVGSVFWVGVFVEAHYD